MARARANGIEIEYETFGARGARPLLLIMGLGGQLLLWEEDFCTELAARGHFVIRYDNRDVGLSTRFEHAGAPNIPAVIQAIAAGRPAEVAYTLDDMADDAAAVLDALQLDSAHVVGASMGGMIAQTVALRHGGRVRSLTSMMSTSGSPDLAPPNPEALTALMRPRVHDREAAIEQAVSLQRIIGGSGFPFDAERTRRQAARSYDRSFYPVGIDRQFAAILASGNRRPDLASVKAPTLVVHGDVDPLIPLEGGRDTARAIPGAELLVIEGLGHELPPQVWPRIIDAISGHTERAESSGLRPERGAGSAASGW
jgi:pimeloyl-ACP methyl ester carboxylesterase